MATQDTIKFADFSLLIGNGAGSEVFAAVCGFTSINWQTSTTETTEDLPDCDDPDAPTYNAPRVTSFQDTVQCQGYVDEDNSDLFYDWVRLGGEKNVRLAYNKGAKVGYYSGPAINTNREENYERRLSGKLNVTIKFTEAPVWHAGA